MEDQTRTSIMFGICIQRDHCIEPTERRLKRWNKFIGFDEIHFTKNK